MLNLHQRLAPGVAPPEANPFDGRLLDGDDADD